MKKIIATDKAPGAIGPYSQAVQFTNMVFTSGQIAIDPATGELNMADLNTETHQVMKNLKEVLAAAGLSFQDVIKTSIFLADMNDFAAVNEIYASYFEGDYPARETVQVAMLPRGVNVEISMIAAHN